MNPILDSHSAYNRFKTLTGTSIGSYSPVTAYTLERKINRTFREMIDRLGDDNLIQQHYRGRKSGEFEYRDRAIERVEHATSRINSVELLKTLLNKLENLGCEAMFIYLVNSK